MKDCYLLQGTTLCIQLPEELDHETSEEMKQQIRRRMEENFVQKIIFDFQYTQFMDSSGIGMIMGCYRILGMRKGCIKVHHVPDRIEKILHLSGVYKFIEIGDWKGDSHGKHQ